MDRTVAAFPVLPGQQGATIADMLSSRPVEYKESRDKAGARMERAYLQETPMGDFVVIYFETDGPAGEALGKMTGSGLAIDADFVRMVKEVHGVDLSIPPEGPPPETIGEWVDPDASGRGNGLALCVPVVPGMEDKGRAFAKEAFDTRKDEFAASRRALGQTVEVVTLNSTPHGQIICVYLEGADPAEGNRKFAASSEPFDVWFKEQLASIFPPEIDFNKPVPGVTELFDSEKVRA